jgi:homoserine dehydrogenase
VETSSTVLSDFVLAAKRIVRGAPAEFITFDAHLRIADIAEVGSSWQITLHVDDQPGVLEQIAAVLARGDVSVRALHQSALEDAQVDGARLVIITHHAPEGVLRRVVALLGDLPAVRSVVGVLRVEGE